AGKSTVPIAPSPTDPAREASQHAVMPPVAVGCAESQRAAMAAPPAPATMPSSEQDIGMEQDMAMQKVSTVIGTPAGARAQAVRAVGGAMLALLAAAGIGLWQLQGRDGREATVAEQPSGIHAAVPAPVATSVSS